MLHQEFYYVSPQAVGSHSLRINGAEFRHLVHVTRKRVGDSATATDGVGNTYLFQISKITDAYADASIVKKRRRQGEPLFQLTLAQAVLKGKRFEQVIEKGTEIGVTRFIPMLTKRTLVTENDHKLNRWQRVAMAAMKQSCRSILPEITPVQKIEQIIANSLKLELKLIAHNGARVHPLSKIFSKHFAMRNEHYLKSGILLIGPEGGLTLDEIEKAQQNDFHLFSMGLRRLRAETAGIVGSALLLAKLGEL